MRALVDRKQFADALAAVKNAVDTKSQVPVLGMVRVTAKAGELELASNNLDFAASATLPCDGDDFAACVPRHALDALAARSSMDVELRADDQQLTTIAGSYRHTSLILPATDFPPALEPGADDCTWTMPAADLQWLLASVSGACESPKGRFYLAGVHLTKADGRLTAIATDARVMAVARRAVEGLPTLPDNIIVPTRNCDEIARQCQRIGKGEVTVWLSSSALVLQAGNVTVSSKLIDGTYPQWRQLILEPSERCVHCDVEELAAAVAAAAAVPRVTIDKTLADHQIGIVAVNGACRVGVKTRDDELTDEIACADIDDLPMRYLIHSQLKTVLDGLGKGGREQLRLSLTSEKPNAALHWRDAINDDYFGMIIPCVPRIHMDLQGASPQETDP